jgi:gamma-glutamylcyclotransferase (GGCT)/AIG2-like uncharacterized protein YtfP
MHFLPAEEKKFSKKLQKRNFLKIYIMLSISPYLFVYSSLRRGFQESAYTYLTRYFNYVSDAKVKGFLSDFGDKPVATPTGDEYFIKGELYKLNTDNASFVFGQLDDYEGLNPEEGQEPLYRREIATVYAEDGSQGEAWVYWYNGDVSGKSIISSGDVLEYMKSKIENPS